MDDNVNKVPGSPMKVAGETTNNVNEALSLQNIFDEQSKENFWKTAAA